MDYHMTDIIPLLPIPQPPYGKVSYNIPCYIFERGYHPTKHLQNRYQRPLRER